MASVRYCDPAAVEEDLAAVFDGDLTDADATQLFESSGNDRHHYLATQGLFQQAYQECFLQTWDDGIDVFAVPRHSWATADEVSFVDLRAPGGVFVSGVWRAGVVAEVTLRASSTDVVARWCWPRGWLGSATCQRSTRPVRINAPAAGRVLNIPLRAGETVRIIPL
jgi:hypothetical protein